MIFRQDLLDKQDSGWGDWLKKVWNANKNEGEFGLPLRREFAKFLLKHSGKIGKVAETHLVGNFRNSSRILFQQLTRPLQAH